MRARQLGCRRRRRPFGLIQAVHLKLQGLTLDEIAERMALSKSTVRRILDSVLQSLTA